MATLPTIKKSNQKKKGGKGCPKLKRVGHCAAKYKAQIERTARNKARRVRRCNGEAAYQIWLTGRYAHVPAPVALPKAA